jgi:hypothetical protein
MQTIEGTAAAQSDLRSERAGDWADVMECWNGYRIEDEVCNLVATA